MEFLEQNMNITTASDVGRACPPRPLLTLNKQILPADAIHGAVAFRRGSFSPGVSGSRGHDTYNTKDQVPPFVTGHSFKMLQFPVRVV